MGFRINDRTAASRLNRHLQDARKREAASLERLSSGEIFTPEDPRPSERAIAEKLEFRIRALTASKRNINDAMSLLQTAEAAMSEVNNMITRMKEINIAAASTTLSNQERRFLFIEYEALFDEINRVSQITEFNGIPLLNGRADNAPERLVFRLGDPFIADGSEVSIDGEDINTIRFENFRDVDTTTAGLGINSARDLLADSSDEEGIELEDVEEMLLPEDEEVFATIYDQAVARLSTQRAIFGGLQSRLNRAMDFTDVYQENLAAAKSRIADADYAKEATELLQARIQSQAATSLLAQQNISSNQTLNLINSLR